MNLNDIQRGYDEWAAKPHNAKWVRKIDGTPIANDIVCTIWDYVRDNGVGEAARIGDAVLAWMVKYDLLDAGNEYRAEDVTAVLDDFTPPLPSEGEKRMREALRPFAEFDTEGFPDEMRAFEDTQTLLMKHFRAARAALFTAQAEGEKP